MSVSLALFQNDDPGKTCLRSFQGQEFEEQAVVVYWHSPFRIVIVPVQGIAPGPSAALALKRIG